jgi:hypothetical protein
LPPRKPFFDLRTGLGDVVADGDTGTGVAVKSTNLVALLFFQDSSSSTFLESLVKACSRERIFAGSCSSGRTAVAANDGLIPPLWQDAQKIDT